MGGSKKNIANEEKNGRKIFDGLTEDIHQLAEDQSHEERKQIQAHHEERSGLQAQSRLFLGGDGKVGGIDEEDHHQQEHAVDRRVELEQLSRLERNAALVG